MGDVKRISDGLLINRKNMTEFEKTLGNIGVAPWLLIIPLDGLAMVPIMAVSTYQLFPHILSNK
jgi:hypothetical protein